MRRPQGKLHLVDPFVAGLTCCGRAAERNSYTRVQGDVTCGSCLRFAPARDPQHLAAKVSASPLVPGHYWPEAMGALFGLAAPFKVASVVTTSADQPLPEEEGARRPCTPATPLPSVGTHALLLGCSVSSVSGGER